MDINRKRARYDRIINQIELLMQKTDDPTARMSTAIAILHHKIDYYFWTGFYFLRNSELTVGPYQGPVACLVLAKDTGVCWAAINRRETIIIADVHTFPGHIACDSRSNSEIVIPIFGKDKSVIGVMDIDSKDKDSFDAIDQEALERIVELIYRS